MAEEDEMKILLTSDWQCSPQNIPLCENVVQHIDRLLTARKDIVAVFHLGDVKHAWNPIDQRVTNFLSESTEHIAKQRPYYVLLGNHDRIGVDDSLPSCLPVLRAAGARVIDYAEIDTTFNGWRVAFVPYIRDAEALRKTVAGIGAKDATLLFFHFEVTGARLNASGQPTAGVSQTALAEFRSCYGGHIHMPQEFGNVCYVGSPFACDWGEANQQKRFVIVDVKTGKHESVWLNIRTYYDEPVPKSKRKQLTARDAVRVSVSYNDKTNLPELLRRARANAAKLYAPASVHVVAQKEQEGTQAVSIDINASDAAIVEQYLEAQDTKQLGKLTAYICHQLTGAIGGAHQIEYIATRAKNVLSYNMMEMQYKPGLTLLTGRSHDWEETSNGAGKSNCLAMPALALFGTNTKGQSYDEWQQNASTETALVELQLKIDNEPYTVTRTRQPTTLVAQHETRGNVLYGNVRSAQEALATLTGMTYESLVNSLYIDQRDVNLLLTGTEKQRKELLAAFLGTSRYDAALKAVRAEITKLNRHIVDTETEQAYAISVRKVHENALSALPASEDITALEKQCTEYRRQAVVAYYQRLWQCDTRSLTARVEGLTAVHNKLQLEVGEHDDKRRLYETRLEELQTLTSECPLCHQAVNEADLVRWRKEAEDALSEIKSAGERPAAMCNYLDRRISTLLDAIELLERNSADAQRTFETAIAAARNISEKIGTAQSINDVRIEHESAIKRMQRKERWHKRCLRVFDKRHEFLRTAEAAVSRDGIPALLLATVCPKLNNAARYYSEHLSSGEIHVEFSIDAETRALDVAVTNAHGAQTIHGQSQGELRIASLIVSFAVRDVLTHANLLILDEPGDGLDEVNARTFAEALPKIVDKFGAVLLTTHNPHIVAAVNPDHRYHVTKRDGVSTLAQINERN